MSGRRALQTLGMTLAVFLAPLRFASGCQEAPPDSAQNRRVVSHRELLDAMASVAGYDLRATTNGGRFQSDVFRHLARKALAAEAEPPPLFIRHEDWFSAFLEVTGLTPEAAPLPARLVHQYGQDIWLDCRYSRLIRRVRRGPDPSLAIDVRHSWPESPTSAKRFSYEDRSSSPHLKVTNQRVITYRLLDFGDMIAYDEIQGLSGRPTSGFLGLLFAVLGEARVVSSRLAVSSDGLQLTRVRSEKGIFGRSVTVLVFPDGRTRHDLPPDRADLQRMRARLEEPFEIDYVPLP